MSDHGLTAGTWEKEECISLEQEDGYSVSLVRLIVEDFFGADLLRR